MHMSDSEGRERAKRSVGACQARVEGAMKLQQPRDREFFRLVFRISLPIAGQNLLGVLVSTMDTIMLGSLGEVSLSAANLGNQLQFIYMIVISGVASGTNILVAQYWGKGEIEPIKRIVAIMYRVVLALALLVFCVAAFLPERFMSIYTTDPAVIAAGAQYLRILAPAYLLFGLASATVSMLRGVRTVRIAIVVYLISLGVNIFFNWIFIFGMFGAPRMEVAGAAVGTLLARVAELTTVILYLLFFEKKIRLRPRDLWRFDRTLLGDYARVASPVICNELLWSVGASMLSVVVGRMGTDVVAANSIATVLNQFVSVTLMGLSNAAAVIIGNTIGQGDHRLVQSRAVRLLGLSVCFGLAACLLTNLIKTPMLSIYTVSDTTKAMAIQIMTVYSVVVIFQAMAGTSMVGILRGGGDVKFVLVADVIFLWVVSIPMGFIAANLLHFPVWAVFVVLKCDELLKDSISIPRILRGRWMKDLTR